MGHDQTADAAVSLRERVKSPPAQALVDSYYAHAVAAGIRFQFEPEMRIHLAHGLMIAEQGIVARSEMAQIVRVLLALREAGPSSLPIDFRQEDLYSYIERYIVGQLGPEVGGRLHTGRSRNDLHVTSWRLALRARLLDLMEALARVRATLLDLAGRHVDTVMPGYTHTQHAQPITFGYYLLSAADLIGRDFRRLSGAFERCDRSPLGAGALSTTGFPIDREMTRDLLGFAGLVEVAYDAVSSRDDVHEAAAALAVMMTGLSRLATDLQAWNTMEYGFVELSDAYSSVSSIMPQKKNPQALEHIKTVAALCTGALTAVLAASKNTSFADVNDGVSGVNVPALEALERATAALAVAEGTLATLTVREEAMRRSAEIGFGTATELADLIVRETGLSFRMAHNVVGRVVREAIEAGRPANAITSADLDAASRALFGYDLHIPEAEARKALDPAENVRSRTVTGGPAPERMAEMLAARRADLDRDREQLQAIRERIAVADATLEGRVQDLVREHGDLIPRQAGGQHGPR
jgi:argininosuccinate lyase